MGCELRNAGLWGALQDCRSRNHVRLRKHDGLFRSSQGAARDCRHVYRCLGGILLSPRVLGPDGQYQDQGLALELDEHDINNRDLHDHHLYENLPVEHRFRPAREVLHADDGHLQRPCQAYHWQPGHGFAERDHSLRGRFRQRNHGLPRPLGGVQVQRGRDHPARCPRPGPDHLAGQRRGDLRGFSSPDGQCGVPGDSGASLAPLLAGRAAAGDSGCSRHSCECTGLHASVVLRRAIAGRCGQAPEVRVDHRGGP
mmetsp:Transcript_57419/g.103201  ORF Transcript_57419/g.103201 Transcript_57419/m.103201 type:complete len:255 (-) Transcript_57419:59-823(-)